MINKVLRQACPRGPHLLAILRRNVWEVFLDFFQQKWKNMKQESAGSARRIQSMTERHNLTDRDQKTSHLGLISKSNEPATPKTNNPNLYFQNKTPIKSY